jgi:hypothetical protein
VDLQHDRGRRRAHGPSPYRGFFKKLRRDLKRKRATLKLKAPKDAKVQAQIETIDARLQAIANCWSVLSERVPVGVVRAPDPVLELARAPKLLCDVVKMTAFHIETMLVAAVGPHLRRARVHRRCHAVRCAA